MIFMNKKSSTEEWTCDFCKTFLTPNCAWHLCLNNNIVLHDSLFLAIEQGLNVKNINDLNDRCPFCLGTDILPVSNKVRKQDTNYSDSFIVFMLCENCAGSYKKIYKFVNFQENIE